jgi:type 1 glutamine amidotransferase
MSDEVKKRIDVVLIAGGKYHDIDFARLELLKLMAEDDRMRVRVFEDYETLSALDGADVLVSYTCDVTPSLEAQEALRAWVERGGRWYALHGTNSILRFLANGLVDAPRWAPHFMETLGSQFIAHPVIAPYRVTVADPSHPLVEGVQPFDAEDEHYLVETYGPLHVLLETEFEGEAQGFAESRWDKASHPVFYIHAIGEGAVLYLTLGHCRGHYDLNSRGVDFYPVPEKGSWALPVFYDLLRRGLDWCKAPVLERKAAA